MRKSDLIAALERIPGDPEIVVRLTLRTVGYGNDTHQAWAEIDRINEFPRPEIVVIEK